MARFRSISVAMLMIVLAFAYHDGVCGEAVREAEDVDIDNYITVEMEFDEGSYMEIEADITATRDPVTVLLIKGVEDYLAFRESEDIDVQAIKEGEDPSSGGSSFRIVDNFSELNVTSFHESITIAQKDTYYLVVMIYREVGMSREEIMNLGSRVTYDVEWEEKEDDVPYFLIPIALTLFVLGIIFIVLYFRIKKRDEMTLEERERMEDGSHRIHSTGRR